MTERFQVELQMAVQKSIAEIPKFGGKWAMWQLFLSFASPKGQTNTRLDGLINVSTVTGSKDGG